MAPEINFSQLTELPLFFSLAATIVPASFVGSFHCIGMCGGLVVAVTRSRAELIAYQIGRGISYVTLGALAGYFSNALVEQIKDPRLYWLALALATIMILYSGISLLTQTTPHVPLPKFLVNFASQAQIKTLKFFKAGYMRSFFVGALSAFLPCGWLHMYVLLALTSHSVTAGASIMGLFWLGTSPALTLAPVILTQLKNWFGKYISPQRLARVAGVVFIVLGLGAVAVRAAALLDTHKNGGSGASHAIKCH